MPSVCRTLRKRVNDAGPGCPGEQREDPCSGAPGNGAFGPSSNVTGNMLHSQVAGESECTVLGLERKALNLRRAWEAEE